MEAPAFTYYIKRIERFIQKERAARYRYLRGDRLQLEMKVDECDRMMKHLQVVMQLRPDAVDSAETLVQFIAREIGIREHHFSKTLNKGWWLGLVRDAKAVHAGAVKLLHEAQARCGMAEKGEGI